MPPKCPVVHFEMPYRDQARMSEFYQKAFGWDPQPLGPEMDNYVLMETTQTQDGQATTPGHINGGMFPYTPERPAQVPQVVIAVEDIDAAMQRVADAGGTVYGTPDSIPGIGRFVAFEDCEGNAASMLQPDG